MEEKIIQFIKKQTCASICCVDEQINPYCFSCYYVFNSEDGLLYFKSSPAAHHSRILNNHPIIAGTILPDKLNLLVVKGIQFEGMVLREDHELTQNAATYYYKKHPAAFAIAGDIRVVKIDNIKMTDSAMGFGKKITWKRSVGLGLKFKV